MKKTLLSTTFSAMMAISVTVVAVAQQPTQQPTPTGPSRKEVVTQQRQAELASKYGLSQTQIAQFEELLRQCNAKYAEINNSQISAKERGAKAGEAKRTFRAQVKDVMSPEQYGRWLADQQQQDAALAKLKKDRLAQLKQIEASNIPESQKIDQRKALEASFQASINNLFGQAQGADIIDQRAATGKWYINNNKGLVLTRSEADALASLAKDKDTKMTAVKIQNLTQPEERRAIESIKNDYNAKVRQALGDQKYTVWSRNNANQLDRTLSKSYGMNPDQIAKYKAIINDQQVAKLQLAQATMSPDEKAAKRDELDKQYNAKLQQVLSPQQYSKVVQDDNYRQEKQAEKRAKLGPRPAPQGAQPTSQKTVPQAKSQIAPPAAQ